MGLYEYQMGLTYLGPRTQKGFLSVMGWIAVTGILVGVLALVVALSFASGFESALRDKIIGMNAHMLLLRFDGAIPNWRELSERVLTVPEVESTVPFTYHQALVRSEGGVSRTVVRGLLPSALQEVSGAGITFHCGGFQGEGTGASGQGDADRQEVYPIYLGKVLAETLDVGCGDEVNLVALSGEGLPGRNVAALQRCTVVGVFEVGMYEYDAFLAFLHLDQAQAFFGMEDQVTGIEIQLKDFRDAGDVENTQLFRMVRAAVGTLFRLLPDDFPGMEGYGRETSALKTARWLFGLAEEPVPERIRRMLGYPFWIKTWDQINPNFFAALKLQKAVMFLVLALIILVGGFNIVSTLIMTVIEKRREIAILKAMGASGSSIGKIFFFQGLALGAMGTALGLVGGWGICLLAARVPLIRLDADIYYLSNLPVEVRPGEFFWVGLCALFLCALITVYPARRAAKLDPAEVLRYE